MKRLVLTLVFLAVPAFAAETIELSVDEFKMFQHYKNAMEDPQVLKIKESGRTAAIAKDAGFKMKELQKAIARGEAAGDVKAKCEANLKEALAKTEVAARLNRTEADLSKPHAVIYLEWANDDIAQLEEEASALAAASAPACPIASTIQVWAQQKGNAKSRVFEGLISVSAASKIKAERIKDFADTRYIRLFEKVKNIANGDDFSTAGAGTPAH